MPSYVEWINGRTEDGRKLCPVKARAMRKLFARWNGPFWWLWINAEWLGLHRLTGPQCGCTKRRDRLTTRWERFRRWVDYSVSM